MRQATLLLAVFLFGGSQTQTAPSLGDDPATFDVQLDAAFLTHDIAFLTAVVADDAAKFLHPRRKQMETAQPITVSAQ